MAATEAPAGLHAVGALQDFEEDVFRVVEIENHSIGVVRTENGLYALLNRCPHRGAPLCAGYIKGTNVPGPVAEYHYGRRGELVRCPWHGFEFELCSGEAAYGVSDRKVKTFPVSVREGQVYVEVPAKGRS